jgi:hypothetical protein
MNGLPDELLLKVMLYSDNNNLHIVNKYTNELIKEKKKLFLENPLTIYYRLVKWTYATGLPLIIHNEGRPEYRPRMKVGKLKKIKIDKIELGHVRNDCNIYPSKKLESELIKPYYIRPTTTPYILTQVPMYNIYSMWIKKDDYDEAKMYEMLYPSKKIYKYIMPTTNHNL